MNSVIFNPQIYVDEIVNVVFINAFQIVITMPARATKCVQLKQILEIIVSSVQRRPPEHRDYDRNVVRPISRLASISVHEIIITQ